MPKHRCPAGQPVEALERRALLSAAAIQAPAAGGDLSAEIVARDQPDPRVALLPNQKAVLRVTVRNVGDAPVAGRTTIRLVAEPLTGEADTRPVTALAVTPERALRLRPGQSRVVPLRFTHPASGGYRLVAQVDPDNTIVERDETNNAANTGGPFRVVPPVAEPALSDIGPPVGGTIRIGRRTIVPVTVWNTGNVAFSGDLGMDVSAAPSGGGTPVKLTPQTLHRRVRLRSGQMRVLRLPILVDPSLPPGQYALSASWTKPGDGPTPFIVTNATPYTAA